MIAISSSSQRKLLFEQIQKEESERQFKKLIQNIKIY